jgi:hypothetical protein
VKPQHCTPMEIFDMESWAYHEALNVHRMNLDDANLFSMHPKVIELVLKLREIDKEHGRQ